MPQNKRVLPLGRYISEASKAYPEDFLSRYFDLDTGNELETPILGGGDTLALFIGREISGLYNPSASDVRNRQIMSEGLGRAARELERVGAALINGPRTWKRT